MVSDVPDPPAAKARISVADLVLLGVLGIRVRPLRSALSTVGVMLGIATLMLVSGISHSSSAGLARRLDTLGADLVLAQAQAVGDRRTEFVTGAERVALRIGPVTAAAPLGALPAVVRRNRQLSKDDVAGLNAVAATPALAPALHATMFAGTFLDRRHAALRTVVLGHAAARNLGVDTDSLRHGVQILVGAVAFTVTGIVDSLPVTPDLDYAVFVGWETARAVLAFDGRATSLYLRAAQARLGQVIQVLGPSLYPADPGLVNVSQPGASFAAKQAVDDSASGLLLGLAGISLIVGGTGVANTMYLAVMERRRDIGLRRALGATRTDIRLQFVAESAVLAAAGSLTGLMVGAAGTVVYATYHGLPVAMPASAIAAGLLGGVSIGVLAGLYPALRAARMNPTQALADN